MGDFSPLDEELELLPGPLTPSLVESLVRLGTWLPFEPAATMLTHFTRVPVSEPTARRATEQAGTAYVELQTALVEWLEREQPSAPAGPELQYLSVDGAMVPLVGGQWAEVKTLAIGTVGGPRWVDGEWDIQTGELSYFSRLTDHATFARLALVETHRRGTERAGRVAGVVDGAEWAQQFLDLHRADATRILDFPHGAEYVAQVGQAVFGAGTAAASEWLGAQLHELKHGDPHTVLGTLRGLHSELAASGAASEVLGVIATSLAYLEKRQAQIRYAEFVAQGYPIGSGATESANKLVMEARLKGAGMHWARAHVNPMVALRTIVCSDRWEEAWPQINARLRAQARERTRARRAARQQAKAELLATAVPPAAVALSPPEAEPPTPHHPLAPRQARATVPTPPAATSSADVTQHPPPSPVVAATPSGPRRPAANHPWRRGFSPRTPRSTPHSRPNAET